MLFELASGCDFKCCCQDPLVSAFQFLLSIPILHLSVSPLLRGWLVLVDLTASPLRSRGCVVFLVFFAFPEGSFSFPFPEGSFSFHESLVPFPEGSFSFPESLIPFPEEASAP